MKLPGQAWLEFKVETENGTGTIFYQTATFIPEGAFGMLYWYILTPAHFLIFKHMARNIVQNSP
jgi:hypothetical protein